MALLSFGPFSSVPFSSFISLSGTGSVLQLIYDDTVIIDGVRLYGEYTDTLLTVDSTYPRYWFGPSNQIELEKDVEYEISYDLGVVKSGSFEGKIDVYLAGDVVSTSSLGTLVASHTIPAGFNLRFFDTQKVYYKSLLDGTVRLRFAVYSGMWHVGSVQIKESVEFGYNPSSTKITVPIVNRRFEHLQFKTELYDVNNTLFPIAIESDPIYFDGGTFQIKGTNNRMDGALILAPSGTGPVLGTNSSGSYIGIGAGTSLPQPIHYGLLESYTGSSKIVLYSGSSPFESTGSAPAMGLQIVGGGSSSFLDFNTHTGRLTIRGEILLLPSSSFSSSIYSSSQSSSGSLAGLQALVSGNYIGGTYLNGTQIISPQIAGNTGYFSSQFGVGNIVAGNGIILSAIGYTASNGSPVSGSPVIYIGAGRHAHSGTAFLVGSSSAGPVFSLSDSLVFQPSASAYELNVKGTINVIDTTSAITGFQDIRTVIANYIAFGPFGFYISNL